MTSQSWRKSSYSGHNEECVEVAQAPNLISLRDSKDPAGPVLTFEAVAWRGFLSALHAGEFDL